jgi:hypothetical protein
MAGTVSQEALRCGAAAALAGTAALMVSGLLEAGSPWAAFNTLALCPRSD